MDWKAFLESLPPDFFIKTGIFIGIVAAIVIVVRIIKGSNKVVLGILTVVVVFVIFFNWVYNRTEPRWLTPVVDKLAHFFPTKDYERKEAGGMK